MALIDKFDKLDRIELDENDVEKIMIWGSKVTKDEYEFKPPMEEGLILLHQHFNMKGQKVDASAITHFKIHDDGISFKQYDSEDMVELLSFDFTFNDELRGIDSNGIINVKSKWSDTHNEYVEKQCQATVLFILNLFGFFASVEDVIVANKQTKTLAKKQKSKKTSKSNSKRIVKVSTIRYTFNFDDSEREHRAYERHIDGWSVRGHWRYIKKSRKWTWVKPHTKGDKDNTSPKTYKI